MPPDPSLQPTFGTVVRRRRLAAGLSQEALAEQARLTPVYISWLETGRRVPSINTLRSLATGLGCAAWELLKEAEEAADGKGGSAPALSKRRAAPRTG
ncbi:MAG TPA: helix-turn-helix transcriptional regulator [Candidatus Dormibacteraeota bacterium]|jgi:transcriptional regulator with XRE-family HTH domain|nr:helix-turn-helix transcriptional regulator [Candidatus Dormibacteraeota bacterium]